MPPGEKQTTKRAILQNVLSKKQRENYETTEALPREFEMSSTQGKRRYPDKKGKIVLKNGEYFKTQKTGNWILKTPSGVCATVKKEKITEHQDGTITISPTVYLFIDFDGKTWRGFLTKGVWREVKKDSLGDWEHWLDSPEL